MDTVGKARVIRMFFRCLFVFWLAGSSALVFAQSCSGVYSSNAAAKAACESARSSQGYSNCSSLIRYSPGVCGAQYHWYMPHGGPELQFGFMAAGGTCPSGYTVSGSTCVPPPPPPPDCAEMQTYIDGVCTPDTPAVTEGQEAPPIGIVDSTTDASGNIISDTAEHDALMAGQTLTYNCGGWECEVAITDFVGGSDGCLYPSAGGDTTCMFIPRYTGAIAPPGSSIPGASVSTAGGSYVPPPPVGCPAGQSLDISGACIGGATAGTPSTPTAPGTAATTGTASCPSGYTQAAGGGCSGPASAGPLGTEALSCWSGYTLVGDQCVSGTIINPDGTPSAYGYVTECGIPGKPACKVENPDATEGQKSAVMASALGAIQVATTVPDHGWTWMWTLPSGSCSSWNISTGGKEMVIDPCPTFDKIKGFLSYAFYIMTTFAIFHLLFGGTRKAAI